MAGFQLNGGGEGVVQQYALEQPGLSTNQPYSSIVGSFCHYSFARADWLYFEIIVLPYELVRHVFSWRYLPILILPHTCSLAHDELLHQLLIEVPGRRTLILKLLIRV